MSADADTTPHDPALAHGAPLDLDAILEEYRRRQMIEHLAGPVVSVLFHMIILVVCFFFVANGKTKEVATVEVNMDEMVVKPIEKPMEEKIQEMEQQQEMVPTVEKPVVENEPVTNEIAEAPTDSADTANLLEVATYSTPLKLPAIYGQRLARGSGGTGGGGIRASGESEDALLRALRWLKLQQQPNGAIGKQHPCAMTGLALLAYLGHGETPADSKEFGTTVSNAIQFLCTKMNETKPGQILERDYSHGIVAYALSEAYSMTQLPFIKAPMEKALKTIVDGQQEQGGWDYGYRKVKKADEKELRFDLSVAGWQIQALKAGHIAEANVPGMAQALEKSISFLQGQAFEKQRKSFMYSQGSASMSMQGVGALCLQMLGLGKSDQVTAAVTAIETVKVEWDKAGPHSTYGWYYHTQAMFYAGKTKFGPWNKMFSPELVKNQTPGPSNPEGKATGFWEPPPSKDPKAPKHNPEGYERIMNTAFACLMLEVYYRFLPSYKVDIHEAPKAETDILNL